MTSNELLATEAKEKKQIKLIQARFIRLSQYRLDKMLNAYNHTQADSIRLLALLFHVNHPILPGYVDKTVPCGIPNYFPTDLEKKIAKTVSRTFKIEQRAYLKFEIAALFLMGSTGTLGQSVKSDLDLWICLKELPEPLQYKKLQRKTELISQWMATRGIELNCYLVHEKDFSGQKQKSLSKDSCGDTQNFLLLDEFYRTAVWLVGRMPVWWIVPPGEFYQPWVEQLFRENRIDPSDWIDFGEVSEIPASEYFSAALWQQYKAIESPFKSFVKLLILEVYARYFPQSGLLSSQYKAFVYQSEDHFERLDPYLMMLRCGEDFLRDQPQRLEFLRRAFYLKSGVKIQLNKPPPRNNWRYLEIQRLTKQWGWNQARLDYLNNRPYWSIGDVLKERKDLIRELTHSYHFLSNFARVQEVVTESSQQQLVALGRKLHVVFDRKSGKIDNVNTGIANNVTESSITLFQKPSHFSKQDVADNQSQQWCLLLGSVAPAQLSIHTPVFSAQTLFEVIAWCVCNQVVSQKTNYQIYTEQKFYDLVLIQKIVKNLFLFGAHISTELTDERFQHKAKTAKMGIFLNTLGDPLAEEKKMGIYSIDKRDDFFCWGEQSINLLSQFDIFYSNTWGERFCRSYEGPMAWIRLLTEYKEILSKPDAVEIYCGDIPQPEKVRKRLFKLFAEWNRLLELSIEQHAVAGLDEKSFLEYRYLMSSCNGFVRINFHHGKVNFSYYHQKLRLLNSLSESSELPIVYLLDENLTLSSAIQTALGDRLDEKHHCYLICHSNQIEVLFSEPQGRFFYQSHSGVSLDKLMSHYQQFFDSVNQRFGFLVQSVETCQFHRLDLTQPSAAPMFQRIETKEQPIAAQYSKVLAIATRNSEDKVCFDLYANEQGYHYKDYGEMVYRKIAQFILNNRQSDNCYPIFVTDLDLSSINQKNSIITYLDYKKSIEQKLNRALSQLKPRQ